jgi:hypothetical protein
VCTKPPSGASASKTGWANAHVLGVAADHEAVALGAPHTPPLVPASMKPMPALGRVGAAHAVAPVASCRRR